MSAIPDIAVGIPDERRGYRTLLLVTGLALAGGVLALVYALSTDPGKVPWAFFTSNWVFFLGVTQFGAAFVGVMRICHAGWARSFYRLAEITTLAFFPLAVAGLLVIYFFGRHEVFYWVAESADSHHNAWLNDTFLLTRNLVAMLVFYVLAFVFFLRGLMLDATEADTQHGPGWRRGLYRRLLAAKQGKDVEAVKRKLYYHSPWILLACALTQTFTAWDFGMMLIPHYHSTVFPMYYMIGNMFAGTAALLLLSVVLQRLVESKPWFGVHQVKSVGITLTAFALLWLYFFWAQFFVSWFGNLPHEYGVIWKQMSGHYGPFFWVQMVCIIGLPICTLIFAAVKRTWWTMVIITLVMNVGVWLNRFLIVVPALHDEYTPFSYAGDIAVTVGLLGGTLFFILLLFNAFPMVSMWEVKGAAQSDSHH